MPVSEKRITRSQRRVKAKLVSSPVTSAPNVCENNNRAINDTELNAVTKLTGQDEGQVEISESLNGDELAPHAITSAPNICENNDSTFDDKLSDIEMNAMTDIFAEDDSTNQNEFCSTEVLTGGSNQCGKLKKNIIIEFSLIFIGSFRCS